MIYYRCKCGSSESIGSLPPDPCEQCAKCGSDLASSPELHRSPLEHEWTTELVETDSGMAELTRCRWCGIRKNDWVRMRGDQLLSRAGLDKR